MDDQRERQRGEDYRSKDNHVFAHACGDLLLRMDLGWFNMVDDGMLPADVKAVVNLIYYSSFR